MTEKHPTRREFLRAGAAYLGGSAVCTVFTWIAVSELQAKTGESILERLTPTIPEKFDQRTVVQDFMPMLWFLSAIGSAVYGGIGVIMLAKAWRKPATAVSTQATPSEHTPPVAVVVPDIARTAGERPRLRLVHDADKPTPQ